jgi:hypothetical protein
MLSYQPQKTQKFAGEERKRREASMSMEQSIENATALTKSLPQMAYKLVATLLAMKDERDAIEEELNKKREEHQKVEASVAAARAELRDIQAERDRIFAMFRVEEKSNAAA